MAKIGLIAGTGVDELIFTSGFKTIKVATEYGQVLLKVGKVGGKEVAFLNRHGPKYCPPHQINARGNIRALEKAGVGRILALAAVGSFEPQMKPGDLVLLSDFIDFTRGRMEYFDAAKYTDVSFPYDLIMRKKILQTARKNKLKVHPEAVYVCTEGPRFESKAEIKMYRQLGADVVGMTQVPEVVLAAEAEIPYAVIGLVTNYAAGIAKTKITNKEVVEMMKRQQKILAQLLVSLFSAL